MLMSCLFLSDPIVDTDSVVPVTPNNADKRTQNIHYYPSYDTNTNEPATPTAKKQQHQL